MAIAPADRTRYILLGIVLVLIVGAIWFLESGKHMTIAQTIGLSGTSTPAILAKEALYPRAIELADPTGFINAVPFTIASLIGKKVILIDFWTYSCVNCQRTLPYLTAWDAKYRDSGLLIVGVHTPEFGFEKVLANVQAAVAKAGIKYPVVLDNDMGTWDAYKNLYWPHEYLIDIDGFIVDDHIGEGGYADTEREIQKLLIERASRLGLATSTVPAGLVNPSDVETPTDIGSPETYFGAMRNDYFGNGTPGVQGTHQYSMPDAIDPNRFYLDGTWDIEQEFASSISANAAITYRYDAKNVYMVAHAADGAHVKVLLDGKPIPAAVAGADVKDGVLTVSDDRLYEIVKGSGDAEHTLELISDEPGLEAYTFTFG